MESNYIVQVITRRPHGGIGAVLKNIESYRDQSLFKFVYLFSEDNKETSFDQFISKYNCFIKVLPALSSTRGFLKYIKELYLFYKENHDKISAIHIHTPNIALPHLLFAKYFHIKVRILHSHNTCYSENKIKGYINFLLIYPLKFLITHRCACGIKAAEFLFGKKSIDSYILHNAIDTSKFVFDENKRELKRKELGLENKNVYGHVGNFLKQKNHSYLIEVFASIKKNQPNAKLLLIGLGPLYGEMKEKVASLGLTEDVLFLGYRTDVKDLLMAMDVFLFPSLFEGFPVALVEAQSLGLPCIVSEKITPEVKITDLVNFLPITNTGIENWQKKATTIRNVNRQKYPQILREEGFDLQQEIQALDNYYLQICN